MNRELVRPHSGEGTLPFQRLQGLGYDLPGEFTLFPVILLDRVSAGWALAPWNRPCEAPQ